MQINVPVGLRPGTYRAEIQIDSTGDMTIVPQVEAAYEVPSSFTHINWRGRTFSLDELDKAKMLTETLEKERMNKFSKALEQERIKGDWGRI